MGKAEALPTMPYQLNSLSSQRSTLLEITDQPSRRMLVAVSLMVSHSPLLAAW